MTETKETGIPKSMPWVAWYVGGASLSLVKALLTPTEQPTMSHFEPETVPEVTSDDD